MSSTPTSSFDFQNFYGSTLTSDITTGTLTIPLATAPTPSEGILIISPDSTNPECIYYTSKGASSVTCPSDGRGWDSSTATAWTQGTTVIMAPTAYILRMLKTGSLFDSYATGWTNTTAPNSVVYNGNRSYTLTFNSTNLTTTLSPATRIRTTRTAAAPTQCTSLNGTTQYWVKTTPSNITFTDDFVVSAYIKLSSYNGATCVIASRYNGTSGWSFQLDSSGRVILVGLNAGAANTSYVQSSQSVPLNKWVHVTAQLDMSTFTATPTTSYVMFEGLDIAATVARAGTNPTALIQAGNLEVGSQNGGLVPFPGKIAQVAVFSAKVTQATMRGYISQGLGGSETSLNFACSFNNSTNDLTANANNLSAGGGSPTATNADSPFGGQSTGSISSTLDYGIIQTSTFSTDTTLVVQVPEGCTIPTSGGVSSMVYSVMGKPYLFPSQKEKWTIGMYILSNISTSGTTTATNYNPGGINLNLPIGSWTLKSRLKMQVTNSTTVSDTSMAVSSSSSTASDDETTDRDYISVLATGSFRIWTARFEKSISVSVATPYYPLLQSGQTFSALALRGAPAASSVEGSSYILAENAYL